VKPLRLIVLGTVASNPYAGTAWVNMQLAVGLQRLGHEVYYFETTSAWPYDPVRRSPVCDTEYALPYLARVAEGFGLAGRWAYRRSFSDGMWFGLGRCRAEELLRHADAVFNVAGASLIAADGLKVGRLVYYMTDPGVAEIPYAQGDARLRAHVDAHDDVVTYGENIGTERTPIPPLPRLRARCRQPILLDLWTAGPPTRDAFTTIGNWRQAGYDTEFAGEIYRWSKHHELLKFLDLPRRVHQPLELAMTLDPAGEDHRLLTSNGWRVVDGQALTLDPWPYREYVRSSCGEFTVAKDLNVRLKSGWFSDRSASYLAAGRPVITQDTGFGSVLPTGDGLFAFNTTSDILAAFEAIAGDYARHSRAARAIAEEYFGAEGVLRRLLSDLDLGG
jgi:hypothetical protein